MLKEKWRRTYKNYLIFEVFSLKKILCLICSFLFLTGCSSFENQIIEVSKTVSPSVIRIEASMKTANPSGELNEALSIGSGVIYKTYGVTSNKKIQLNNYRKFDSYEYYCLTNRHVVNDSYAVKVWIDEKDIYCNAKILGIDDKLDVAIIQFTYDKYIDSINFSTSELKKGSIVLAVGNPDGYNDSISMGVVSYPARYILSDTNGDGINDYTNSYIQIDAAINPGSSGGGLFNTKGELVGINTMKIVSDVIEGIGFAIPIEDVKQIIPYLEQNIVPQRLLLGITVNDISLYNRKDINYGAIINNIKLDGYGYQAGLRVNDVILEINNHPIKYIYQLFLYVNTVIVGNDTKLEFLVDRNGEKMTFQIIV